MQYHFKSLRVWQSAMKLLEMCEEVAMRAQQARNYSLADQMRRSALSIPSNIAEGREGGSDGVYSRHVRIAIGSAAELRTQLIYAQRCNLLSEKELSDFEKQLDRVVLPLYKLRGYLAKVGKN